MIYIAHLFNLFYSEKSKYLFNLTRCLPACIRIREFIIYIFSPMTQLFYPQVAERVQDSAVELIFTVGEHLRLSAESKFILLLFTQNAVTD